MSHVICCVSYVTCHMSHVRFFLVVDLVGGGSVINGAYPVYFIYSNPLQLEMMAQLFLSSYNCLLPQKYSMWNLVMIVGTYVKSSEVCVDTCENVWGLCGHMWKLVRFVWTLVKACEACVLTYEVALFRGRFLVPGSGKLGRERVVRATGELYRDLRRFKGFWIALAGSLHNNIDSDSGFDYYRTSIV